jgi:hypothetical protein
MSLVSGSDYRCEQLFSLVKNLAIRARLTDEHLEGFKRSATETEPDIKDYSSKISYKYLTGD